MASMNTGLLEDTRGRFSSPDSRLIYGTVSRGKDVFTTQKKRNVLCSPRNGTIVYRHLDEDRVQRNADKGNLDNELRSSPSLALSSSRSRGRPRSSSRASVSTAKTQRLTAAKKYSAVEREVFCIDGQRSERGTSLCQEDIHSEASQKNSPDSAIPASPVDSSGFTGRLIHLLSSLKELVSDRCACSSFIRRKKQSLPLMRKKNGGPAVKVDLTDAGRERPLVEDCVKGLGWESSISFFKGGDIRWLGNALADYEHEMHVSSSLVVNRFPGFHELTKKRCFARVLSSMQELQPDEFSFFPLTWVLPEDRAALEVVLRTQPKSGCSSPPFPPSPIILPQPPTGGANRHFLAAEKLTAEELSKPQEWPSFYHISSGSLNPGVHPTMCGLHRSVLQVKQVRETQGRQGERPRNGARRQREEKRATARGVEVVLVETPEIVQERNQLRLREVYAGAGAGGLGSQARKGDKGEKIEQGHGSGEVELPNSISQLLKKSEKEISRTSESKKEDKEVGVFTRTPTSPANSPANTLPLSKWSLFLGPLLPLAADHLFPRQPKTVEQPDTFKSPERRPISRARPSPLLTLFPLSTWSPVYTTRADDNEFEEGEEELQQNKRDVFIVKPDCGAQGIGVRLLCSDYTFPDDILDGKDGYIVQQYIANPFLLGGKKFDFRIYVLVLNVTPQPQVFISRRGLVRFCTEDYEPPNEGNLNNAFMHLTNYAINKEHRFFRRSDNVHARDSSKRLLEDVFEELLKHGVDVGNVWQQVVAIVERTMAALAPLLCLRYRGVYDRETCRCFQIIGFDILLDKQCKAWLLEVNANPSLRSDYDSLETRSGSWGTCESQLDRHIKEPLVREALVLVYFSMVGPRIALGKYSKCRCRRALYSSMQQRAEQCREKERKRRLRRISCSPTQISRSNRKSAKSPVYVSLQWRRLQQRPPGGLPGVPGIRADIAVNGGLRRRSFSQGEQGIFCSSPIDWGETKQQTGRVQLTGHRRPRRVAAAAGRPATPTAAASLSPVTQAVAGFPSSTPVGPLIATPAVTATAASDYNTQRLSTSTPAASAGPLLQGSENIFTTADPTARQQEGTLFFASTAATANPSLPCERGIAAGAAPQAAVKQRLTQKEGVYSGTQDQHMERRKLQQQQAGEGPGVQQNETKTPQRASLDAVSHGTARRQTTGETLLPFTNSLRSPATTTATTGGRGRTPINSVPRLSSGAPGTRRPFGEQTPASLVGSNVLAKRCKSYFSAQHARFPIGNPSQTATCSGPVIVSPPAGTSVVASAAVSDTLATVAGDADTAAGGGAAGASATAAPAEVAAAAAEVAATAGASLEPATVYDIETSPEVHTRVVVGPDQPAAVSTGHEGMNRESDRATGLLPCKRRATSICTSQGKPDAPHPAWGKNGGKSPRKCSHKTGASAQPLRRSSAQSPRCRGNKWVPLPRDETSRSASRVEKARRPSHSVTRRSRSLLTANKRSCSTPPVRRTGTRKGITVCGGDPAYKEAANSGVTECLNLRRRQTGEAKVGKPQKREVKAHRAQSRSPGEPVSRKSRETAETSDVEQLRSSLAAAVTASTHAAACIFSRNMANQCCVWEPLTVVSPLRQSVFDPYRRCVRRLLELSAPLLLERCRHLFERVTCFPVRRTVQLEDWLTLCRQSRLEELTHRLWVATPAEERSAPVLAQGRGGEVGKAVRTCRRFAQRPLNCQDLVLLYMRQLKEEMRTQAGTATSDNHGLSFWFFWELLCLMSSLTDLLITRHRDYSNNDLCVCRLLQRRHRDFIGGTQTATEAGSPRVSVSSTSSDEGSRPGIGSESSGSLTPTGETAIEKSIPQQDAQPHGTLTHRRRSNINDTHDVSMGKDLQSLDSVTGAEEAKDNQDVPEESAGTPTLVRGGEAGCASAKWSGFWNCSPKSGRQSQAVTPLWFIHQKPNILAGADDSSYTFNSFIISDSVCPPKGTNIDVVVRPGDRVFVSWLPDIRKGFYSMTTEQRTIALDCLLSFFGV